MTSSIVDPFRPTPANDDTAAMIETQAALDVLRERMRLADGGELLPEVDQRDRWVRIAAMAILRVEMIDRQAAVRAGATS